MIPPVDSPPPVHGFSPLNILHWLDLWWREIGGPIRSVAALAEAMHRRGHRVTVATADARDVPSTWWKGDGPAVAAVRHGRFGDLDRSSNARMRELVREADVVHLNGVWEPTSATVARIARSVGRPYLVTPRGVLDDWSMTRGWMKKRLHLAVAGGRMLRRAHAVHCTAAGEARQVDRLVPGTRLAVIPNLLDLESLLALSRRESESPRILFLGRVHPKKGLDRLLDAIALLDPPFARLDVAGGGDERHVAPIRRQVDRLGIGDRVEFHGHVEGPALLELMSRAWLMALPTSQENFGNALFECLAAGLPVVTSDDLDTSPELRRSGGAILVPRDSRAIADAVSRLLGDAGGRRGLGVHGREWIRTSMDPRFIADRYELLYERAADTQRTRTAHGGGDVE